MKMIQPPNKRFAPSNWATCSNCEAVLEFDDEDVYDVNRIKCMFCGNVLEIWDLRICSREGCGHLFGKHDRECTECDCTGPMTVEYAKKLAAWNTGVCERCNQPFKNHFAGAGKDRHAPQKNGEKAYPPWWGEEVRSTVPPHISSLAGMYGSSPAVGANRLKR